jgi:hypothetical protein
VVWTGLVWLGIGTSGGLLEQGNEPSDAGGCTTGGLSRRAQLHGVSFRSRHRRNDSPSLSGIFIHFSVIVFQIHK